MRRITAALILLVASTPIFAQDKVVLAIHGGAISRDKAKMSAEQQKRYRTHLEAALKAGHAALAKGTSLDAVEAAIQSMEASGEFDAGRGSVFNREGRQELNASIMEGKTKKAGAIAGVCRIKHPISAARLIMDRSEHVFMIGESAERFCREHGMDLVSPLYLWNEKSWKELKAAEAAAKLKAGAQNVSDHSHFGTVGAVAIDADGNLAAGTSTGGITYVRAGRVGDSPIIGAGTYADNETCAVSCTGKGELFMRHTVASDIAARMKYRKDPLNKAVVDAIAGLPKIPGGAGGVVAIDREGNAVFHFSTNGMNRGAITKSGKISVAIYED